MVFLAGIAESNLALVGRRRRKLKGICMNCVCSARAGWIHQNWRYGRMESP